MTLHDVANSVFTLSVGGHINGENFSRREFIEYVDNMFRTGCNLYVTVELPDGEWLVKIYRFGSLADMYDYYIPDTRGEEQFLYYEFLAGGELDG